MSGIQCPECRDNQTSVRDSRPSELGVRRRRCCVRCGHRFTTYETTMTPESGMHLRMVSREALEAINGAHEKLQRIYDGLKAGK